LLGDAVVGCVRLEEVELGVGVLVPGEVGVVLVLFLGVTGEEFPTLEQVIVE
jgi:hypothetical protein